jgi:hypothetical protein
MSAWSEDELGDEPVPTLALVGAFLGGAVIAAAIAVGVAKRYLGWDLA